MSWVFYFKEMATKEATKALSEKAFADTLSATQYDCRARAATRVLNGVS